MARRKLRQNRLDGRAAAYLIANLYKFRDLCGSTAKKIARSPTTTPLKHGKKSPNWAT